MIEVLISPENRKLVSGDMIIPVGSSCGLWVDPEPGDNRAKRHTWSGIGVVLKDVQGDDNHVFLLCPDGIRGWANLTLVKRVYKYKS